MGQGHLVDRGPEEELTVRVALERLKAAQKPSAGTPLYSRIVNRPVGRVFAAVAAASGLGPNAVSLISSAFSLAGIALVAFATPTVALGLLVGLLLVVGYALDSADGQVARLTGKGSVTGEWLDHMLDAVKIACLHTAVAWSALEHASTRAPVAVALGFGIVTAVMFFGMILTDQLRRAAGVPKETATSAGADRLRALVLLPGDYGVLCLAFLFFGAPSVFYAVYGFLGASTATLLVVAVARWRTQLRLVDDARRTS